MMIIVVIVLLILMLISKPKTLTIVSAYYEIPSKRSADIYHERLKHFLGKIDCPMVFYTSRDLLDTLMEYRKKWLDRTKFHVIELDDLEFMKKYGLEFWKDQCSKSKDPAHVDKPLLGGIWYSKNEFLMDALTRNSFGSTHFAWVDAGIMDEPYTSEILYVNPDTLGDKMTVYSIQDIPLNVEFFDEPINYIAGDTFYGPVESVKVHVNNYRKMFEKYIQNGRCAFDDQYILNSVVSMNYDKYDIKPGKWRTLFKQLTGHYFVSVYAMFKNEEEVIEEWLTHYIEQGVDHFYLIDNGSTDNYMDVIKPYMNRITLIHEDETGNDTQIPIYNRHIKPVLHESTWVIGIDLDEFMYTKTGTIASTLRDIDDSTIGQILVPWKYFGSSGHLYQPKSLRDSFVYRKQTPYLAPTKMICKSEALEEIGIHSSKIKDGYKTVNPCLQFMSDGESRASNYGDMILTEELLENSLFKLNHYMVQSLDWFRRIKMTRGSANFGSNHRNEEYFKQWDCNDIFDDDLVHKNYWLFALLIIYMFYIHIR